MRFVERLVPVVENNGDVNDAIARFDRNSEPAEPPDRNPPPGTGAIERHPAQVRVGDRGERHVDWNLDRLTCVTGLRQMCGDEPRHGACHRRTVPGGR
ncbi:hypothetical protein GALL_284890 [mine drainage metagenome]|uniref:Uncharacterized protein n=1 Tax=mine drainage metagenome TaxID=410659 RepID=A0A1J5R296_9ZZZZ